MSEHDELLAKLDEAHANQRDVFPSLPTLYSDAAAAIRELRDRDKYFGEEFANQDFKHNEALNRLSHRHAEQIQVLKARIAELEAQVEALAPQSHSDGERHYRMWQKSE